MQEDKIDDSLLLEKNREKNVANKLEKIPKVNEHGKKRKIRAGELIQPSSNEEGVDRRVQFKTVFQPRASPTQVNLWTSFYHMEKRILHGVHE